MDDLITRILDLEQLDTNLFRSRHHCENYRNTLYGGQVLSQALRACALTLDEKTYLPHSLHAYFLRSGSSEKPVIYDVEVVRNGSGIMSRRCVARQYGRPIFNLSCSFHRPEDGFEHQITFPQNIQFPADINRGSPGVFREMKEFDKTKIQLPFETLNLTCIDNNEVPKAENYFWIKCKAPLHREKIHHICALAFASDLGLLATAIRPHYQPTFDNNLFAASIDHAMWFHDTSFTFDEWLLCHVESPWAGNGRGFSRCSIFTENKKLIATTSQEGIFRLN